MSTIDELKGPVQENLAILVHGEPGVGKSWLGQTSPWPRLVLDAEGGSRSPKRINAQTGRVERVPQTTWDPMREPPPKFDGTWETCRVVVRSFDVVTKVYEWLNMGDHDFRSLVIDSLTEMQKRCKDGIRTGDEVMNERMWGILLDQMESQIRKMRDLLFHPTRPLEAIVLLALSYEKSGKVKPAVQGALGTSLPGYLDVIGHMSTVVQQDGSEQRHMLIRPDVRFEAKDRTHTLKETFGPIIVNPDVAVMVAVLNQEV